MGWRGHVGAKGIEMRNNEPRRGEGGRGGERRGARDGGQYGVKEERERELRQCSKGGVGKGRG